MPKRAEGLASAERKAERHLRSTLHDPVLLATLTFNLLGQAISAAPPDAPHAPNVSPRVTRRLLVRVANDLRATSRVACLGYALQAASLAAGLYEAALTVIHIGTDESLARKWISHKDPRKAPWSPKQLTESVASRCDAQTPEHTAETLYSHYTQLCMAKHVHPMMEIQHTRQIAPGIMEAVHGPEWSERSARTAAFALLHGAGLALIALRAFVGDHVPHSGAREKLLAMQNDLGKKQLDLMREAAKRWPGNDPFPGKWLRFSLQSAAPGQGR